MSIGSLALVLAAAVCHAVWNMAAKNSSGQPTVFVWMYFTLAGLLCTPLGLIVGNGAGHLLTPQLLFAATISGIIHIAYSMTLQTGYSKADLGVVYPVARGTGPLITVVVAVTVLGDRPAPLALAGGIAIIGGILVVTGADLFRGGNPRVGLAYGLATGVAIAGYTLWDDYSVAELGNPPILYYGLACIAQSLLMAPGVIRRRNDVRETWRRDRREVLIAGTLSPAAYVTVLFVMQTTSVALVAPVRESSIVIGALLAWWVYKEPDPLRRIVGAGVVATGIALIAVA
ncbi:MAG: DMT family transporter [Ancrocorticia sp.]|uniref:DMT family transporter n=1 Tax=Ancrocorticia sp. TaxID=2593684 RepID=UPI003F9262E9